MLSWIFVYIHIFMYISQIGKEGTAQRGRFRCQWRQEPISYQLWFAREETYVSDRGGPMTHDRWSRLLTLFSVAEARKLQSPYGILAGLGKGSTMVAVRSFSAV